MNYYSIKRQNVEIRRGCIDHKWYICPKEPIAVQDIDHFVEIFTESLTIEDAFRKIEDVIGYKPSSTNNLPGFNSEDDAEFILKYFLGEITFEILFD